MKGEYLRGRKADDPQELPLITELPTGLPSEFPNAQEDGTFGLYAGRFGLLSWAPKLVWRARRLTREAHDQGPDSGGSHSGNVGG